MKIIRLSKGLTTQIDDCDFELVNSYNWCALTFDGKQYAVSNTKGKQVRLHRMIMNASANQQVDHIDGNGLNNQRYNLRLCKASENYQNRKLSKNNTSGYKGVNIITASKAKGRFRAVIYVDKKCKYIGTYSTAIEAAAAYNEAAIKYHGNFANLNKL